MIYWKSLIKNVCNIIDNVTKDVSDLDITQMDVLFILFGYSSKINYNGA